MAIGLEGDFGHTLRGVIKPPPWSVDLRPYTGLAAAATQRDRPLKWALGAHFGHCKEGMERLPGMLDGERSLLSATLLWTASRQHLTGAAS